MGKWTLREAGPVTQLTCREAGISVHSHQTPESKRRPLRHVASWNMTQLMVFTEILLDLQKIWYQRADTHPFKR